MKYTIWIVAAALAAAGLVIAQAPAPPGDTAKAPPKGAIKGKGKAGARTPAQSPASRPVPKTVTEQTYPAEQVAAGANVFGAQCGFCHGRDATGGETGPDLTRSPLIADDNRGDKIGPLVKAGRADEGMPAFTLSSTDLTAIVAYVHSQKTKIESEGGDRRTVDPSDLATGNAAAGKTYFNGACAGCHSATGDLQGIATKLQGLALLQRMLWPSGRSAAERPKATVTLASGEKISGSVTKDDEFAITLQDAGGMPQTFDKKTVTAVVEDPLAAHFTLLGKYTDADMHNVFAYLDTLK